MAFISKVVFLLLLSTLAWCQVASEGNTTATMIVQGLNEISTLSNNLRLATQLINRVNAPLKGYIISEGFSSMTSAIVQGAAGLQSLPGGPLSDDDAKLVVEALKTHVLFRQALLNVVIGKHGIITLISFFEPIRQSLVRFDQAVELFGGSLIALIPTPAYEQFGSLSVTLNLAISTYEQPYLRSQF